MTWTWDGITWRLWRGTQCAAQIVEHDRAFNPRVGLGPGQVPLMARESLAEAKAAVEEYIASYGVPTQPAPMAPPAVTRIGRGIRNRRY